MTQNNVDADFVDGLQLIIDSLIKEGAEEDPPEEAPKSFDDWFQGPFGKDSSDEAGESANQEIQKILPVLGALAGGVARGVGAAAQGVGRAAGAVGGAVGDSVEDSGIESASDVDLPEADHWCPDVMDWHTPDHEPAKAPSVHINVDNHNGDDPYKSENADKDVDKEYDQKTNLPPEFGKPEEGESIAEPFLRRREDVEEDIEKQEGSLPSETAVSMAMAREYNQSLDVLKIWASVDRVLPKDDEWLKVLKVWKNRQFVRRFFIMNQILSN